MKVSNECLTHHLYTAPAFRTIFVMTYGKQYVANTNETEWLPTAHAIASLTQYWFLIGDIGPMQTYTHIAYTHANVGLTHVCLSGAAGLTRQASCLQAETDLLLTLLNFTFVSPTLVSTWCMQTFRSKPLILAPQLSRSEKKSRPAYTQFNLQCPFK